MKELILNIPRKYFSSFFPMLQAGCRMSCKQAMSVENFLVSLPGFEGATILDGIQTVFLDGQPLDDLKAAMLGPDSELALSAAMPGALGAVMRRGGYYASMRKDISFTGNSQDTAQGSFKITVKVFNLLLSQLGPSILEKGVILDTGDLAGLLANMGGQEVAAQWNHASVSWEDLKPRLLVTREPLIVCIHFSSP